MGRSQKQKGYRVERKIVKMLEAEGIKCRRQPMSGAILGMPHDIVAEIMEEGLKDTIEVKARKSGEGFKTLKRWKGLADVLVLVEDNEMPTVVVSWNYFINLINKNKREIKSESTSKDYQREKS